MLKTLVAGMVFLLIPFAQPAAAAGVPQEVMTRLSYLIKTEIESQSRASMGGVCSEEGMLDATEKRLALMEESVTVANVSKAGKFNKLIDFFKDKMTYKCCQLAGKSVERKFKGGGGVKGLGGGGGGGGGKGRGKGLGR